MTEGHIYQRTTKNIQCSPKTIRIGEYPHLRKETGIKKYHEICMYACMPKKKKIRKGEENRIES